MSNRNTSNSRNTISTSTNTDNSFGNPDLNLNEGKGYVDPFAGTEDPAEEFEALENARREQELLSEYISFKSVETKIVRIFPARGIPIVEKEFQGKKTGI
jgi:hypothetical protein